MILLVSLIFVLGILVFMSIQGEKNYLENCKGLEIECEEGNVHKATESFQGWLSQFIEDIKKSTFIDDIKKKFNG